MIEGGRGGNESGQREGKRGKNKRGVSAGIQPGVVRLRKSGWNSSNAASSLGGRSPLPLCLSAPLPAELQDWVKWDPEAGCAEPPEWLLEPGGAVKAPPLVQSLHPGTLDEDGWLFPTLDVLDARCLCLQLHRSAPHGTAWGPYSSHS